MNLRTRVIALAIHEECEAAWDRRAANGALAMTMHGFDAHEATAARIDRALTPTIDLGRDVTLAFVRFLEAIGWPHDVTVHDDEGQPVIPPIKVLDALVEHRIGMPLHGDNPDAIRWVIEEEAGVRIWSEDAP